MLLALLLLVGKPHLSLRVQSPAHPAGLARGARLPPRRPRVKNPTWAARVILTVPF